MHSKTQMLAICQVIKVQEVPRFNSTVFLKGQQVGKIEEVFGPINKVFVAFKGYNGFPIYSLKDGTVLELRSS